MRAMSQKYDDAKDIVVITADNPFEKVALVENKDVLVLFHTDASTCLPCGYLAPYFKQMSRRVAEMKFPNLVWRGGAVGPIFIYPLPPS